MSNMGIDTVLDLIVSKRLSQGKNMNAESREFDFYMEFHFCLSLPTLR